MEAKLDEYLAPYVARRDFSGAVLIARGDTVLVRKAYGMASYELRVTNSPETRFRIASLTKTFTAAAVIMLQERGRLSFDDPVSKFLPDYPRGDKIKIRHLLAHQGGVANPDYAALPRPLSLDQLIDHIKRKPLDFEPGTSDRYSSGGYVVLARIVEKASGQTYEDFLSAEIFAPLNMRDTGTLGEERLVLGRASGYVPGPEPDRLENASALNTALLVGSGCLASTVDDLFRWAKAVRSEQLYHRSRLKYPYGWGKRQQFGHRYDEQSGLVPGFISHLIVCLDQPVTIVCLGNIESGIFGRLEKDLIAIAFGEKHDPAPPEPEGMTVEPKLLAGCLGRYRGPDFTFRIVEDSGKFYGKFDEGPARAYLLPTGRDEFFMRSSFANIHVGRDPGGRATQLSILWGGAGQPMKLPRIPSTDGDHQP
jgi:CubicO group peptidase (beta-lactamase class C family)